MFSCATPLPQTHDFFVVRASSVEFRSGMVGLTTALCTTGAVHRALSPDAQ
jgi:hypothetical protein